MWAKITGALGAIIGFLLILLKFKNDKIEKLDHENKVNEKVKEIRKEQDEIKEEIINDEEKRIEDRVKDNSNKSRRDRASKL